MARRNKHPKGSTSERYDAAFTRLQELKVQKAGLERTISDARMRLASERHEQRLDAAAEALRSGETLDDDGPALRDELSQARQQLPVVVRAIESQEKLVNDLRTAVDREQAEAARPALQAAAQVLADRLVGLGDSIDELEQLRSALPNPNAAFPALANRPAPNSGPWQSRKPSLRRARADLPRQG